MKKVLLSLTCLALVMFGCSKENTNPTETNNGLPAGHIGMFRMDGNGPVKTFSIESLRANHGALVAEDRSNNQSANGHFTNPLGQNIHTFSIVKNNGGVHGSYTMMGGFLGEINMTAACIVVEGNRATVSGQITQIENCPYPFEVGDYLYFCHEDNGEGNNAPADRSNVYFYWGNMEDGPECNIIPPSEWPDEWVEVLYKSDQIQVKN